MKTFLKAIADSFYKNYGDKMADFCYVFPNKRCCLFFNNYVESQNKDKAIFANSIDIENFVLKITQSVEAPYFDRLFILYDCYRKIVAERSDNTQLIDFDSFASWGEMILNDFNDIDIHLINAEELLKNIKNFKSIATNYLEGETLEIVNEYFKDPYEKMRKSDDMWQYYKGDNEENSYKAIGDRITKLWAVLYELYTGLREELSKSNVCYKGMAYRKAAEEMDSLKSRLKHPKYVFIGFNALSPAEEKIFSWFQDNDIGDFYWDSESVLLNEDNPASRFVNKNKNNFKSELTIDGLFPELDNDSLPETKIVGVPSRIGQAKYAVSILTELNKQGRIDSKGVNTALILPDEEMCTFVLRSLPEELKDINITMGYPLNNTPITSLLKSITFLCSRASRSNGEITYYYKDLLDFLSQPILNKISDNEAYKLQNKIISEKIYFIKHSEIVEWYPTLAQYITIFEDNEKDIDKVSGILDTIIEKTVDDLWIHSFAVNFRQSFDSIQRLCKQFEIHLSHTTIIRFIIRLASGQTIRFAGEPLYGAQIMGILETRALDFENLIILSMNEKIYPKKLFRKSIIPYNLRVRLTTSTPDAQEGIYAYYFYRLFTRSKNVYLVHDSRAQGAKSEMSRYLYQLKFIFKTNFGSKLKEIAMSYDLTPEPERKLDVAKCDKKKSPQEFNDANELPDITIENGERILTKKNIVYDKLKRYFSSGNDKKYLSASAFNTYLACQLKFFFRYIAGLPEQNDDNTYVDSSMYGTIMHEAFQNFYEIVKTQGPKTTVFNAEILNDILKNHKHLIVDSLVRSFDKNYYRGRVTRVTGQRLLNLNDLPKEILLLAEFMVYFMECVFNKEIDAFDKLNIKQYEYLYSEKEYATSINVDGINLNVKCFIDRVDKVTYNDGRTTYRLIDYKTGSDELIFSKIKDLFEEKGKRPKAILQLFLYSNIFAQEYAKENGITEDIDILPMIYKLRELAVDPLDYLKYGTPSSCVPLTDYKQKSNESDSTLNAEFLSNFKTHLEEMLNKDIPLKQNKDFEHCKYCDFKNICGV